MDYEPEPLSNEGSVIDDLLALINALIAEKTRLHETIDWQAAQIWHLQHRLYQMNDPKFYMKEN